MYCNSSVLLVHISYSAVELLTLESCRYSKLKRVQENTEQFCKKKIHQFHPVKA